MRYRISETAYLLGKFDTGNTVTISLYNIATGATVTLSSNSCSELGSTGVFKWGVNNIQTPPESFTEYLWIMTSSTISQYGKLSLGGFPDQLDAAVSTRLASADYAAPDNAGIAALPTLAEIEASTVLAKEATVGTRLSADDYVAPDNAGIAALPTLAEVEASTVLAKQTTLDLVRKFMVNRMKVDTETNQLYLYDDDGVSIIYTFDLKDEDGNPTSGNVYDRVAGS